MTQPSPTLFDALRRYWWIALLLALVGAGAGVAYGLSREPVYTAEARLSVGRVDVATQSIPGFVTASLTLADTYSRAIVARPVIARIKEEADLSQDEVSERVTASPIPETAIVRVFAEADTAKHAVDLANLASDALIAHVRGINRFNPDSKLLLERYRRANEDLSEAIVERTKVGENSAEAEAAVKTARLRTEVAGGLYQSSQAGQASPNTLQVLAVAGDADSDRAEFAQRAGFVGAVGGIALGALLALLLGRRALRRKA